MGKFMGIPEARVLRKLLFLFVRCLKFDFDVQLSLVLYKYAISGSKRPAGARRLQISDVWTVTKSCIKGGGDRYSVGNAYRLLTVNVRHMKG